MYHCARQRHGCCLSSAEKGLSSSTMRKCQQPVAVGFFTCEKETWTPRCSDAALWGRPRNLVPRSRWGPGRDGTRTALRQPFPSRPLLPLQGFLLSDAGGAPVWSSVYYFNKLQFDRKRNKGNRGLLTTSPQPHLTSHQGCFQRPLTLAL